MNKFLTSAVIVWLLATTMTVWTNVYANTDDTTDAALDSVISWLLETSTTSTDATATPTAETTSVTADAITGEDTGTDLDALASESTENAMVEPTNDSEVVLDDSTTLDNANSGVDITDAMVEPESYDATTGMTTEWVSTSSENISAWNDVATPRTSVSTNRLSSAGMWETAAVGLALLASLGYVFYQRRKNSI